MHRKSQFELLVFCGLVMSGVWLRLALQDIPNFAPVAAMAMFAGYYFRNWIVAVSVPLCVMVITDIVIGGYTFLLMAIVYAMLAMPVAFRGLLRKRLPLTCSRFTSSIKSVLGLVACGFVSSVLFFVVTNLATWGLTSIYNHSLHGLISCYTNALPFFRYTLSGDLTFAVLLFGCYAIALRWHPITKQATIERQSSGNIVTV